ncbi:MAG: hypothetical protein WA790_02235 [Sulfitobacter sp.]
MSGVERNLPQLAGLRKSFLKLKTVDFSHPLIKTTINALNIDEIVPIAQDCAKHGLKLTYSYYSPTDAYQNHVTGKQAHTDNEYLRISSADRNLRHRRNICGRTTTDYQSTGKLS